MKTPEGMQQLEELFHESAGLKPPERAKFIARLRHSNPELAAELESLLSAHEQTDSPIDAPAYEVAAEMIAGKRSALIPGQLVGHYQVVAPLGKGGMGEVYLASDTKLDRKVALKFLPSELSDSKDFLRRFTLEAKAASSLNHPNIITIHEIGQTDGIHYIASEYIDGQTLKQRMRQRRLSFAELLDVAVQIASALEAAHAAGLVHRDIKPENIMVRPDGYVKVLDFGLAKLTEKSQSISSESETMIRSHTKPGTVLGTVDYMSPEQARGKVLDQRTDVFSLGIVLYEMATGRKPFTAASSIDTLVSILEKEPAPLTEYAPEVSSEFRQIVDKALRKDREERYQTIKELLIDLKDLREELAFAQKLERSRPAQSNLVATKKTADEITEAPTTIHPAPVAITAATNEGVVSFKRRVLPIALAAVVLGGLAIGAAIFWRRTNTPPPIAAPAPTSQRTLNYWITVQKYRDGKPYEEPFRLSDDINFEKDYQIRLGISSPQSGHLYLLNEGPLESGEQTPTFNLLFPSATANNGSELLPADEELQIPQQSWLKFDEQQGTEKIWVVWAAKEVPEMEAVKGFANPRDRGVISSPGLQRAVYAFVKAHSSGAPTVERDQEKKQTVVKSNNEILVHVIKLEHH
jgi:serine/threonine protein kinase